MMFIFDTLQKKVKSSYLPHGLYAGSAHMLAWQYADDIIG